MITHFERSACSFSPISSDKSTSILIEDPCRFVRFWKKNATFLFASLRLRSVWPVMLSTVKFHSSFIISVLVILLRQLMSIYVKNNPVKCHFCPIWNDGALDRFRGCCPNKGNNAINHFLTVWPIYDLIARVSRSLTPCLAQGVHHNSLSVLTPTKRPSCGPEFMAKATGWLTSLHVPFLALFHPTQPQCAWPTHRLLPINWHDTVVCMSVCRLLIAWVSACVYNRCGQSLLNKKNTKINHFWHFDLFTSL